MDEDDLEPLIHPETGEQIGWQGWNADGLLVALSLDGSQVTGALDPSDNTVWNAETGEWTYADELDAYACEVPDDVAERIDALEQRAEQPTYLPYPVAAEPDPEQQTADLFAQAAHWERVHGRPMTLAEKRRIGEALTEAQIAGDERPDLQAAADRLAAEGRGLPDIDAGSMHERREKRQALMSELLGDRERLAAFERGEGDITQAEPPGQRADDVDTHEGRVQYALDRQRGAADAGDLFSSSEFGDDAGIT